MRKARAKLSWVAIHAEGVHGPAHPSHRSHTRRWGVESNPVIPALAQAAAASPQETKKGSDMEFHTEPEEERRGRSLECPDGVFWADHIKTLRDQPAARLAFAEKYQPVPAAFREAAIALRALIRSARKAGLPFDGLLKDLYRTAARDAFLFSKPQILGRWPAYNAVAHLKEEEWRALEFPYRIVGHLHLRLLNKTDRKWIEDAWGPPDGHANPHDLHRDVFDRGVRRFQAECELQERRLEEALRPFQQQPVSKSGCLGVVMSVLALSSAAWLGLVVL